MNKKIKELLEELAFSNFDREKELRSILFSETMYHAEAIFVAYQKVVFLFPDGVDEDYKNTFFQEMIEILEWLEYLERNRLVYVWSLGNKQQKLYYKEGTMFSNDQAECEYRVGSNLVLRVENDGVLIMDSSGCRLLSGNSGPGYLYDKFFHFFDSVVYPTISLRTFIKNGYLTDEQKNAKDALNVAHLGVWISLFVACISPFAAVFVGNSFGVSTLNSDQYNRLIGSFMSRRDTCVVTVYKGRGGQKKVASVLEESESTDSVLCNKVIESNKGDSDGK